MNAKIVGTALVVTSSVKTEEIKELAARCPDALNLYEGEGDKKNMIFNVSLSRDGDAELQDFCIVFNGSTHDAAKKATATVMLRGDLGPDPKETIADIYGVCLKNLKKWEEGVPAAMTKVRADHAALVGLIEV